MKARNLKRRQLVQALGLGSLALGLPLSVFAQGGPTGTLSTTTLAEGISMISGAGTNVVVAEGPDSVVVIDGGLREHAQALLDEINRITGDKPIAALFNTNWRPEHTGLNYLLGPRGVDIIGHEYTRLWQSASFMVDWEDRRYEPMPEEARINQSFYREGNLSIGDHVLEYGHLPQAHTDGDIYVYFHEANVMVASDLLAVESYPIMDWETGGWVGGFQEASEALVAMVDDDTRIVPAHGDVQSIEALQAQVALLEKGKEAVAEAYRNGLSLKEFKAQDPASAIGPVRPGAERFVNQLYDSAWGHIRELGGMV